MYTLDDLDAALAAASRARVVVAGDPCLDENVYGRVETVAKEAPIVALEAGERVYAPGQAANVAANVAALGGRAALVGVVGADETRDRLLRELAALDVDVAGLVVEAGRATTHKVKLVAREPQRHRQHLLHVYWQGRRAPGAAAAKALRAATSRALAAADVLVFSDYDNGTLSPAFIRFLFQEARRRRVFTVANARGDLRKFRGVALAVANREELRSLAGARAGGRDLTAALAAAAKVLGAKFVAVTAGDEGMYVWPVRARARHLPSAARGVVDVTGAGDTVTAALAVALGGGLPWEKAAAFANVAAAVACAREGTAAPTGREITIWLRER